MAGRETETLAPQWRVFGNTREMQRPFDAAVIMPTIGRPEAIRAIQSVFDQAGVERIQLLIGVDRPLGDIDGLIDFLAGSPRHVTACLFYPGYSTSFRHGGLHPAGDGGVLRSTLTHLANARCVSYLDDDNWWADFHLASLLAAMAGHDWAFSLRWFVHPDTLQPVCVDAWESVGPSRGVFAAKGGGFVDPNCLMFDKLKCWPGVTLWNEPLPGDARGMSADRQVFDFLRRHGQPGETGRPSAYYVLAPGDEMHGLRMQGFGAQYAAAGQAPAAATTAKGQGCESQTEKG